VRRAEIFFGWATHRCKPALFDYSAPTASPARAADAINTMTSNNEVPTSDADATPAREQTAEVAKPVVPAPSAWLVRAAGILVPALILFPFLGKGGIWDPHELNVADLARRIGINLWGASSLNLADADNAMPTIEQLGKGELPFTSIAAGFAAFGLHEWAGRLPLALWAMAGILSIYWLLARLMDERAGAFGSIVLSTMPLFFVQARTMLGDIVTIASVAMAVAGLGILVFDHRKDTRVQVGCAILGTAGLAGGFLSRGLLIGLALPLLTVGLAWLVSILSVRDPHHERISTILGATCAASGIAIAAYGSYVLFSSQGSQAVRLLGTVLTRAPQPPAFDHTILYLGHALFPWSAFIPFAIGRLFRPGIVLPDDVAARERGLRVLLVVGASLSFGVLGLLTIHAGHIPFAGVALLAAIAAVAIRDLERGAPASRTLALGVVTFLFLFYQDFKMWPDKAFSAFGVESASFPDSFKQDANRLILAGVILCAVMFFASWLERDTPDRKPFVLAEYLGISKSMRAASNGNLMFVMIVVEAALVVFAILFFVGLKMQWKTVVTMSATVRTFALNGWWAVPVGLVAAIALALLFRDLCRWLFPRLRISRASATLAGGAVAGAILSFSYYPALASQLSPKEVFESYAKMRSADEPLALLGVSSRTASYYAGGAIDSFRDVDGALNWLLQGDQRKWLVVRNEDLARLNSTYRSRTRSGKNIPVLDARSSQILLASNQLRDNEKNHNPLDELLLAERPQPSRPLDVDLQGQLKAIGWDIVDPDGRVVDSVVAGRKYRLRLYFEVIGRITRDWECFIHIDGHGRRFNGDHHPMDKKYPMTLWQVGDILVDDYPVQLEPNFTPGGYMLYYGFFVGNTRLKVTRGKHHEDRIEGGTIQVR
jgi:4-amino-4-deoxy-L-arabinose transferase-like glycosyltransferase